MRDGRPGKLLGTNLQSNRQALELGPHATEKGSLSSPITETICWRLCADGKRRDLGLKSLYRKTGTSHT
ncbi:hypothetical protein RRG08_017724 [Elysia crispata]|uniref:Uncharacterized protein n=1 Tax=Elysia crispata TaxID=231223 RepID=A0AAE1CKH5_9GAST|nr:hypothetical protein RRG08_017724 [Elysia crispata]